jgi:uncharacterized membrane protein
VVRLGDPPTEPQEDHPMTDQPTTPEPAAADAAATSSSPAAAPTPAPASTPTAPAGGPDEFIGLATDGAYALIVAQFRDMATAEAAYATLQDLERSSSLRIDGVVLASCDEHGDIHLGKVTDHSTKTGLRWGVVGGVVLGVIFPPSVLASAAATGLFGAVLGKLRNVGHRADIASELADVMTPGTSGIIALVEDTAVVEIRKALVQADRIVTKAVDKQVAAQIDRDAALAKDAVPTT